MSVNYLDTSALIKRYVAEIGSEWVHELLTDTRTPTAFTSHLTVVEAACAFARRRRDGLVSQEDYAEILMAFDHDVAYLYNILDVTPEVIETARSFANEHPLRAYDAVHLATAWLANRTLMQAGQPSLTFVCADARLLSISGAVGLATDNPLQHS